MLARVDLPGATRDLAGKVLGWVGEAAREASDVVPQGEPREEPGENLVSSTEAARLLGFPSAKALNGRMVAAGFLAREGGRVLPTEGCREVGLFEVVEVRDRHGNPRRQTKWTRHGLGLAGKMLAHPGQAQALR